MGLLFSYSWIILKTSEGRRSEYRRDNAGLAIGLFNQELCGIKNHCVGLGYSFCIVGSKILLAKCVTEKNYMLPVELDC